MSEPMPATQDGDRSRDEVSAMNEDGRVQLTRRSLPDRANRIADDLAGIAHELREGNAGTSDQRLRLAATTVGLRMLADDVREQLAAANGRADTAEAERDRALRIGAIRKEQRAAALGRLAEIGIVREEWATRDGGHVDEVNVYATEAEAFSALYSGEDVVRRWIGDWMAVSGRLRGDSGGQGSDTAGGGT